MLQKLNYTFDAYQQYFPELIEIEQQVNAIPLDLDKSNPYTYRLLDIGKVLGSRTDLYVVRHLHHNFSKDLEAYLSGASIYLEEAEPYLSMPH
jgi:hypothetical protein